ncbi:MAG TPA: DUF5069 domain-containing protein [Opitutaceae bacterium]|nr:DUF5069 domain-containing protein [Opitutaceae bacterium]
MPEVPGLRSPYAQVGRLVYVGRMLDKIRLHAAGRLPAEYVANLGSNLPGRGFDHLCCTFLDVDYAALTERTLQGGTDEEILAWCHARGGPRTDLQCEVWNGFLSKRGWRDAVSARLQQRIHEYGLEGQGVETFFDLIDRDEDRDPAITRAR